MKTPSLLRLSLLRLCYLLLAVGLALQFWPLLFGPISALPSADTTVVAMLCGLSLVSFLGLIAPLRMLPVLLWEIVWKATWSLSVALPKWLAGEVDARLLENMFAVSFVIPFLLIFPWRYFAAELAGNRDRWR